MKFALLVFVLTFATVVGVAGTVCPAGSGGNPFPYSPDNAATGCNMVITIAPNGTASLVVTDSSGYDGGPTPDDYLVGVVNHMTAPLTSVTVSSVTFAFLFDGNGMCTYTFVGSGYCTPAQIAGTDPQDYQGPTSTFSNIASGLNSGTVNFSPPVPANGGTTYFSLDNPPTGVSNPTFGPSTTPVPSSWMLLGIGFASLAAWQFGSCVLAK